MLTFFSWIDRYRRSDPDIVALAAFVDDHPHLARDQMADTLQNWTAHLVVHLGADMKVVRGLRRAWTLYEQAKRAAAAPNGMVIPFERRRAG